MTMINPDKPITKQDLSDFYGKILPYMGGMPDVLANKFARGDLYDTNEKMIGKWINGKPLYQKVYSYTTRSQNAENIDSNFVRTYSVDEVVYISSFEHGIWNEALSYVSNNEYLRVYVYNGALTIQLKGDTNVPVFVIVNYTKSTDSANSFNISSETDYSTDEHIVGTWIDGSYLYQLTKEKEFTLTDNLVLSDLVGIDNIKLLVSANVHTNYIYNNEKWSQKLNPRIDYIKSQTYPNGAIRFGVSSLDNGAPVKSITLLYTKY